MIQCLLVQFASFNAVYLCFCKIISAQELLINDRIAFIQLDVIICGKVIRFYIYSGYIITRYTKLYKLSFKYFDVKLACCIGNHFFAGMHIHNADTIYRFIRHPIHHYTVHFSGKCWDNTP
ncbi:hypothetical protein D9M68_827190 [compost metagenome]